LWWHIACGIRAGVGLPDLVSTDAPRGIVVVCKGAFEVENSYSQLVNSDRGIFKDMKQASLNSSLRHACDIDV
jgi:hypothetical protein